MANGKGKSWPSERKTSVDRLTGLPVTQLTDYKAHSYHLYFTENGWYDHERRLLFISDRENSTNLFSMEVESGEMTQLTDYKSNDHLDASLLPDGSAALVKLGSKLIRLDLGTLEERLIYEAPPGYKLGNASATADSRHVLTCVQEDLSHRIRLDLGNGYVGHRELMEAAPHSMIVRIDANGGGHDKVYEAQAFITHINASVTEPWLMTFCHEGPWHLVDHRIWGLDLRTGEAWKIRERLEEGEKVGHEFFFPDGITIGYHGFRADGTNFFGSIRYDNTGMEETEFGFDTWHGYADGHGQAIVDGKGAVKTLSLWRKQDGKYEGPRMLCELRCSFHSQKVHAHPRFDAEGKRLLFTSDKNGYANLYLIDIPEPFDALQYFSHKEDEEMEGTATMLKEGKMSGKIAETILSLTDDRGFHPQIANKWGYVSGMALLAISRAGDWTGEQGYQPFVRRQMDVFIGEDGAIGGHFRLEDYNLDHVNKGKNLLRLWRETGEEKYKKAARLLITQLIGQPRTEEGGYWHKKIYPYQMWLDGLYMSSPFMAEYAATFQESEWFDEAARQLLLVEKRTRNPQNGLLHHAWDETREQRWCDGTTGRSRYVWGRAMGWYAMALVDALEHFPADHSKRGQLMGIFERMCNAVLRVQDHESGVWYQLMDCNGREGNYLEASGSSMLTYAMAKGIRLGYLAEIDRNAVNRAYEGILEQFVTEDEQGVHLHGICHGAGLGGRKYRDGSYDYYMSEAIVSDALMGVAPFLLASVEIERLQEEGSSLD